jgi:hypothetical protein
MLVKINTVQMFESIAQTMMAAIKTSCNVTVIYIYVLNFHAFA